MYEGDKISYWDRRKARELAKKEPNYILKQSMFDLLNFGSPTTTLGSIWRVFYVVLLIASVAMVAMETTVPKIEAVAAFPASRPIPDNLELDWEVWKSMLALALSVEVMVTVAAIVEYSVRLWSCTVSFDTRFEVSRHHVWNARALHMKRMCLCYDVRWRLVVWSPRTFAWLAPVSLSELRDPSNRLVVTERQALALVEAEVSRTIPVSGEEDEEEESKLVSGDARRRSTKMSAVNPLAVMDRRGGERKEEDHDGKGSMHRAATWAPGESESNSGLRAKPSFRKKVAEVLEELPRGKMVVPTLPLMVEPERTDPRRRSSFSPLVMELPNLSLGSPERRKSSVSSRKTSSESNRRPSNSAVRGRFQEAAREAYIQSRPVDPWRDTLERANILPPPMLSAVYKQASRRMLIRRSKTDDTAVYWKPMERHTRAAAAAADRTQVFADLLRQGAIASVDDPTQSKEVAQIRTEDVDAMRKASAAASRVLLPIYRDMHPIGPLWMRLWYIMMGPSVFDLLVLLPLFLVVFSFQGDRPAIPLFGWSGAAAGLRVVRGFRILKILRYIPGVPTLLHALTAKMIDLSTSALMCTILATVLAGAVFIAETEGPSGTPAYPDNGTGFDNLPNALYFAFISLTTIGYGDTVPATPAGRVLSGLGALIGIGIFSLPSSILAAGFAASSSSIDESRLIGSRKLRIIMSRIQLRRALHEWRNTTDKLAFISRAVQPSPLEAAIRRRRVLAEHLVHLCGNNPGVVLATVASARTLMREGNITTLGRTAPSSPAAARRQRSPSQRFY